MGDFIVLYWFCKYTNTYRSIKYKIPSDEYSDLKYIKYKHEMQMKLV